MRIMCKIIFSWLLGMIFFPVVAQQYQTVLPYQMIGGKMIVELSINGSSRSFIFDTGGRTALTSEICEALGLDVSASLQVTDVNSNQLSIRL